jgi:hypothetical protein
VYSPSTRFTIHLLDQLLQHHAQGQYATVAEWLAQRRMGAQEKGPGRMAGPPGGNEAVLIPMYANNVAATTSISTVSQNLLRFLVSCLCAASCGRFWTVHCCCRRIF